MSYVPGQGNPSTTFTIDYTDPIFKAASGAVYKILFTLVAGQKLAGSVRAPQIAFAGTGMTAIACSLGSATGGNAEIYAPALSVMQTTETDSRGGIFSGTDLLTPDASLDVVLAFTATGANFGNGLATVLTQGKIWVTIYTTTPPLGA